MRLPGADVDDEHDVGGVGDEAAVEGLDGSRSRSGCASNENASGRLRHREACVLDAGLDAALPACGHLQMHQMLQVVGRRLTLADGLLGKGCPCAATVDGRSAFRAAARCGGSAFVPAISGRPPPAGHTPPASGAGTAIRASSGRRAETDGLTGGGPALLPEDALHRLQAWRMTLEGGLTVRSTGAVGCVSISRNVQTHSSSGLRVCLASFARACGHTGASRHSRSAVASATARFFHPSSGST